MSNNNTGAVAGAILVLVLLAVWTTFQYVILIAAFVALTGLLKVLMGVLIVGSILVFCITLFVKALAKK